MADGLTGAPRVQGSMASFTGPAANTRLEYQAVNTGKVTAFPPTANALLQLIDAGVLPRPSSATVYRALGPPDDIGAVLYQLAARCRYRPRPAAVPRFTTLARRDIQALAPSTPTRLQDPPAAAVIIVSARQLGTSAASAQQAARLFRALADPNRQAILLTRQAGEQRMSTGARQICWG